jgi:hypothetical protein
MLCSKDSLGDKLMHFISLRIFGWDDSVDQKRIQIGHGVVTFVGIHTPHVEERTCFVKMRRSWRSAAGQRCIEAPASLRLESALRAAGRQQS